MNLLYEKQYQQMLSDGMKMLGDAWTLLIINYIRHQEKRFSEIEKAIWNVNPVTLTRRLKRMEQCGLIKRNEKTRHSVSYQLTKKGMELLPIIDNIEQFIKTYTPKN